MTEVEILSGIRAREGDQVKNDPTDPSDPSKYGIGAPTLGEWRKLGRPATLQEITELGWDEALQIYILWYIRNPGFVPQNIPFEPLRLQLIDFGVNSGQVTAVKHLQQQLGVKADGSLGSDTRAALWRIAESSEVGWYLINNALVASRLRLLDSLTDQRTGYKKYEEGLESRALSFFLSS